MAPAARVPVVLLVSLLCLQYCITATLPRGYERLNEELGSPPKKRPFCNAFTGCGRKRSASVPVMQELARQAKLADDEQGLQDTEGALEDITRQILSEAKLWEAIQEASAEISRRKQREMVFN